MDFYTGPIGLHQILEMAYERRVSDIHFNPDHEFHEIRYRLNGILQPAFGRCDKSCIQALKLLSHIDLSERKLPGEGHFTWEQSGYSMEVRVSTIPTVAGVKLTLRCLPVFDFAFELDHLGLADRDRLRICQLLASHEGLLLAAGSTGSGKTTTLYAMLVYLINQGQHVISLENPVERRIPGVTQIEIGGSGSISFAEGIRAALRQDPNVIMIGEIRDEITAHAAVQASLTGHLVLTSVHAADAQKTLIRLLELHVHPLFLRNSLLAVISHEFRAKPRQPHPKFTIAAKNELEVMALQQFNGLNQTEMREPVFSIIAEQTDLDTYSAQDRPIEKSSAFVRGWLDFTT